MTIPRLSVPSRLAAAGGLLILLAGLASIAPAASAASTASDPPAALVASAATTSSIASAILMGTSASAAPAPAGKVPIAFDDFHGYTGTVDYLKKVAAAYPGITELIEIGRSAGGNRPIYVLVVTDRKSGTTIDALVTLKNPRSEGVRNVTPMKPHQGKPGHWIDGGTHGNEYTGTEVCLYIIDRLVSLYGADADITSLVDGNTFYLCPIVNPDGVYNSAEGGISQRGNSMPLDNDGDGRVDEDGPDDLDGDGVLAQFRYPDPAGRYVIDDTDPRIMVRLGADGKTDKPRYSVIREDKDNDGDGRRGEDGEQGFDLNRNYPEGWWRDDDAPGGTGGYPTAAPETRAIVEFFTNHTNILMVQSFHTSGGFTYRPFARWPDARLPRRDAAVFDRVLGDKYLELLGEKPAGAADASQVRGDSVVVSQARADADALGSTSSGDLAGQVRRLQTQAPRAGQPSQTPAARPATTPTGWRHPYNETQRRPYGYGVFLDWAYAQFGAWAVSTELWNWRADTKGLPGYAGEDDRAAWERAFLAWQEKALGGKAFIPWKKFKHPELGNGEIGGYVSRYSSGNAIPGETLRGVCERHWKFEKFRAGLLPKIRITAASAKVLSATGTAPGRVTRSADGFTVAPGGRSGQARIVLVTATIENAGALATHTEQGAALPGNREDVVWLLGERGKIRYIEGAAWMKLGVLPGTLEIPGAPAEEAATQQAGGRPAGMMMMRGGFPGGGFGGPPRPAAEEERVKTNGRAKEVTWVVAVEGDGPLRIVVSSQKGGTAVRELALD